MTMSLQVEKGLKAEKSLLHRLTAEAALHSALIRSHAEDAGKKRQSKAMKAHPHGATIVGSIADLSSGPVKAAAAAALDSDAPNAAERQRTGATTSAAYDTQYGDLGGVRGALVEQVGLVGAGTQWAQTRGGRAYEQNLFDD